MPPTARWLEPRSRSKDVNLPDVSGLAGGDDDDSNLGLIIGIITLILSVIGIMFAVWEYSKKKEEKRLQSLPQEESQLEDTANLRPTPEVTQLQSPYDAAKLNSPYGVALLQMPPQGHARKSSNASRSSLETDPASVAPREPPRALTSYFGAGDRRGEYQRVEERSAPVWPDR